MYEGIDCIYYNEFVRCYKDGKVERLFKQKGWCVVENTANDKGYNHFEINGKWIRRHRLIAYCFLGLDDIKGDRKTNSIDHIDENKLNNAVSNLRIATNGENQQNKRKVKGYTWNKACNKWQAKIKVDYKHIHLGYFDTKEGAKNAYLKAKEKYHKFNPII